MNINQDKRVKETTHPRPINAIPPVLWMQAAIITLGAFSTMLSSTMLSAALPAMAIGLGYGLGNTMDSNGVSYGPCGRRSAERMGGQAVWRYAALALWAYFICDFLGSLRPFPTF
jgi:hypothetical protein